MAATADQIARVRRMTNEKSAANYADEIIQAYIERYPIMDARGAEPPIIDQNEDWLPTYDLHAAAADIWEEKAAVVSARFDFRADGGNYSRSQEYEHCMKQARYYRSCRSPKTITLQVWPNKKVESAETD